DHRADAGIFDERIDSAFARQEIAKNGDGDYDQRCTGNNEKHIVSPLPYGRDLTILARVFWALTRLGSVHRTARIQPNQRTAKNNVKETGKLASGKVRSKTRPIATTTSSQTATIKT